MPSVLSSLRTQPMTKTHTSARWWHLKARALAHLRTVLVNPPQPPCCCHCAAAIALCAAAARCAAATANDAAATSALPPSFRQHCVVALPPPPLMLPLPPPCRHRAMHRRRASRCCHRRLPCRCRRAAAKLLPMLHWRPAATANVALLRCCHRRQRCHCRHAAAKLPRTSCCCADATAAAFALLPPRCRPCTVRRHRALHCRHYR
jgi:hypothetical protein